MKPLSPPSIDTPKKTISKSSTTDNNQTKAIRSAQQYPPPPPPPSSSFPNNNNNNNNNNINNNNNSSNGKVIAISAKNTQVISTVASIDTWGSSSAGEYDHIIDIPLQATPPPPPQPSSSLPAYELQRSDAADLHGHLRSSIKSSGDNHNNSNNNNNNNSDKNNNHFRVLNNGKSHSDNNHQQFVMNGHAKQPPYSSSPYHHPYNGNNITDTESSVPSNVESDTYLELHEAAQLQNNPHLYYHQRQQQHHHQKQQLFHADDNSTILTANYVSYDANRGIGDNNMASSSYDATDVVHEMHLALLYLLSNPEEFQNALAMMLPGSTFQQWNAEYDNESIITAETEYFTQHQKGVTTTANINNNATGLGTTKSSSNNNNNNDNNNSSTKEPYDTPPLPFVVFADDAEVVLPQAHTASQLFGIERLDGIELEAAAGIPALCQLFLRWLALMPGGDHLNIIDPPGLTVMRIAGGRYRVTAAHRVVWTWMNEFAQLTFNHNNNASSLVDSSLSPTAALRDNNLFSTGRKVGGDSVDQLQVGDLVTMTIVDVFETDNNGKLLSYCPTFDNRAITKTNPAGEAIRKSSTKVIAAIQRMRKSKLAIELAQQASALAMTLRNKVDKAVYGNSKKDNYVPFPNTSFQIPNLSDSDHNVSDLTKRTKNDSNDHDDDDEISPTQQQQPSGVLSFESNSTATKTMMTSTTTSTNVTAPADIANTNPTATKKGMSLSSSYYLADDDLERHEI